MLEAEAGRCRCHKGRRTKRGAGLGRSKGLWPSLFPLAGAPRASLTRDGGLGDLRDCEWRRPLAVAIDAVLRHAGLTNRRTLDTGRSTEEFQRSGVQGSVVRRGGGTDRSLLNSPGRCPLGPPAEHEGHDRSDCGEARRQRPADSTGPGSPACSTVAVTPSVPATIGKRRGGGGDGLLKLTTPRPATGSDGTMRLHTLPRLALGAIFSHRHFSCIRNRSRQGDATETRSGTEPFPVPTPAALMGTDRGGKG